MKALLEIEMPASCGECILRKHNGAVYHCGRKPYGKNKKGTIKSIEKYLDGNLRAPFCPLKPLGASSE